jgi:mRNA interferase RelE/StbE
MSKVVLSSDAERVYRRFAERNPSLWKRVRAALLELEQHPLSGKPLKGALQGQRSVRIGEYRIVYEFRRKEDVVLVHDILPRGRAYR